MGFTDDVVIRIGTGVSKDIAVGGSDEPRSPPVENLVIDVRSVSRVGVSDLGKNAARIDSFLNALQNQLKN
jgi:hypothetical protein